VNNRANLTGTSGFANILLLAALLVVLQACGITRVSKKQGQFVGEGVASWYGPNFHGKQTANGETYDMDELTAAHRTLPFNTRVRVINLENDQTVVVRINDRGPYAKGRIIDLSRKAASKIGMIRTGTAQVRLMALGGADTPIDSEAAINLSETFTLQLGSFKKRDNAEELAQKLEDSFVRESKVDGKTVYRVYYGQYSNPEDARQAKRKLQRDGYQCFIKQL